MKFFILLLSVIFCLTLILLVDGKIRRRSADDVKPDKLLALLENARITIDAKITYGDQSEDEVPLAGKFYLLDESIISILRVANFIPTVEDKESLAEEDYLEALARLLLEPDPGEAEALLGFLLWEKINTHQISVVETDYFGRGRSGNMKAGNYYVFACQQICDETFVWNYPVYLSGKQIIEMDQYNAVAVFSLR